MTKRDIINRMVQHSELNPSQATHAVEAFIEIIADALVVNEPVLIRGFGTIKTVRRAAKTARDIDRGKVIQLPSCRKVKFTAYSQLLYRINSYEPSTH